MMIDCVWGWTKKECNLPNQFCNNDNNIWLYKQMIYIQPRICPGEWDAQNSLRFWHTNRSPNLGQTTRPYINQQNKKKRTCRILDLAVTADHRVKLKESKKKAKYLDLARELKKKTVEHKSDGYTNCIWCSWYSHQRIGTRTGGLKNNRMSGDCPNYNIIEIGQNAEKSPGDLLSLKLQWKTIS